MSEATVKPNSWLQQDLDRIPSEVAYNWSPRVAWATPTLRSMKAPLEPKDAKMLRERMARRYEEWTGSNLGIDLERDRLEPKP